MRKAMSLLLGLVMTSGLFSAALAADLPRSFPVKAPPLQTFVPLFNWTGFYLGGNIGYGWSDGDGTITAGVVSGPYSGSGNGVLGGVQAGFNWQMGNWVWGIEADFQASGVKGSVSGVAGAAVFNGEQKVPWFGTIRGRLGYAFDRTLIYVTGGGVYGRSELNGTSNVIVGPYSVSQDFWTWTVGGGVEQALWASRWSAKLEYLYISTPDNLAIPPNTAVTGDINNHIVRVGMNYRF